VDLDALLLMPDGLGALDPWMLVVVVIAGIAAGFVNTMAGGGSMLTLPSLMLLGLPADLANGTNRLCIVSQSVSGVYGFHRAGQLDLRHIAPVLAPTILGSLVGAQVAAIAPREVLKPALLGTMLVMATVFALRPKAVAGEKGETPRTLRERPAGFFGLFVAGLYGGFVQAGVGFVLLSVLGGMLRYDLVRANALKLACTLVFGVVALGVFVWHDQIVWLPAVVLAVSTVIGSLVGVRFALKVKQGILRWIIFGCVVATCLAAFLKG
jgi:uncharacterized membrane protein YfcA